MKLQAAVDGNTVRNQFRVAIVGCSHRSSLALGYFQNNPSDGNIVGLCDIAPKRAEMAAKYCKLDEVGIFDDEQKMIESVNPDIIFICTADHAHADPSVIALKAGVHVFCEKPMAVTLEDCDKMAEAAQKSSAVFYLGFNLRHTPVHDTIHHLITTGHVGKVTTIEANEYYYGGKTYFRRWNRFRKFGGGLWLTKACHDFDLLNWMAGAPPKTVYAVSSLSHYNHKPEAATRCRDCKLQYECPDYVDIFQPRENWGKLFGEMAIAAEADGQEPSDLCLFNSDKDTFDNGIAVVTYENDVRTTYTVNVLASRSTRQMRIIGTDGMIEGDMENGTVDLIERHTKKKYTCDLRELMKSGHGGADDIMIQDFLNTCRTGKKAKSSWQEGRLSVQVALAARESCDKGEIIRL